MPIRQSFSHAVKAVKVVMPLGSPRPLDYRTTRLSDHLTIRPTGQAALEMLLVLLILVPLLFGGIELARGVGIRHSLDSGVGVAARAISLDPSQWSWAVEVIEDSVTNNILGGGTATTPTVRVFNDAGMELTSGQLAALGFGETFRLQAETTYTPWLPLVTGGGQVITIRVSHWGIVEQYP